MGKCISKRNDSNNPPFKEDRENMPGKWEKPRSPYGRNKCYDFYQPKHERQNQNICKIEEGTVARFVESFNLQDFKKRNENDKKRQRMSTGIGYNSSCINSVTSINSLPSINTVNKNESQLNVSGMEKGTGREPGASYYSKDSRTSNDTEHIASLMENKSRYKDKYPTIRTNKPEQEGPDITHELKMGKLTLFWKPFSNRAVKYLVCVYENNVHKYSEDVKRSTQCIHELKDGKAGKQYSFKITPVDSFGGSSSLDYGPIEFQGAPSIPTGKIKIETKSRNSIRISWGIPENNGGCPLKGFIVEKQSRLKSDWKQCEKVYCSNLSVEIHDISPTEKYVFRVKAFNDIMAGDSLTSEEYIHRWNISNKDRPQEPLGPLTYTVIADGIVKLCWSQDECRDKHFTKIKVQQSLSDSSEFTDAKTKNIERNSCDVTFLGLDQKYNFRVAGVSSDETVGYWLTGGFYPVFPRLEKPNPPSCLKILYTGDQEEKAYIQWKESDTNGSMVSRYIVLMKLVKENDWLIVAEDITNNSVNCPFHLMDNHKKYHFQVMAENEKGFSFPSETSEEIINKSVPSAPRDLNCEIKETNVLLKWKAPESDGGYPILHYWLKPGNDNWIELPANKNKHTIKKLFDNPSIEFAIVAENVKGESEESFFSYKVEESTYERSVTNKVTEKRYISKFQITLRHRYSIIKGLPNVGMTCYANCIFQILGQTPGLLQHLKHLQQNNRYLDRELSVVSMLIRLITGLNRTDEENCSIVNFNLVTSLIDVICLSDTSFARGKQNDCHSFMMALFNTVKDEMKTQDRSRSRNRETSGRRVKSADRLLDKPGNQTVYSLQKRSQSNRRLTKEDEDFGGPHIDANMKTINIEKESPLFMFEGYLSRRFTYEPCGHDEFSDKQLFTSILVPVRDHMIFNWSVEEGLDLLCTTEEFDGNDLPCTLCSNEAATKSQQQENKTQKKKITKSKQIFTTLPNILIVQIGKFREDGTRLEKMHKLVKYKEYLHVTETCVSEKQQVKEIKKKYMLYGVALHSGTINFGHYYAYVRKNSCDSNERSNLWYECNDSSVFPVSQKDVLNDPKAFLLFYKSEKI